MESQNIKPEFNDGASLYPPFIEAVLLILTMLFCMLIAFGLTMLLQQFYGAESAFLKNINPESVTLSERNYLRFSALISNGMLFLVPGLVFAWFVYRGAWQKRLRLSAPFNPAWLLPLPVFVLSVFFFSQFTYWLNQMLPLPAWAATAESQTADLVTGMLRMDGAGEFLFTFFVVAIVPAVGEELIFRGIIQRRLEEIMRRPHTAVWISAIIFSFVHFQFAGFLPRVVLGLMLGYLFLWTRNLWVPILAHLLINGVQVGAAYAVKDKLKDIDPTALESIPASQMLLTAAVSLIFIYLAGQQLYKIR